MGQLDYRVELGMHAGVITHVRVRCRGDWALRPLVRAAIDLCARPTAPRMAYLGIAKGDRVQDAAMVHEALSDIARVKVMALLPQPNVPDLRETLLCQDVIYVGDGSAAGLLALWRLHGLDEILREAWELGIVLLHAAVARVSFPPHTPQTTALCFSTKAPTSRMSAPMETAQQRTELKVSMEW